MTTSTTSFSRIMSGSKKQRDNYLVVPTTDMRNVFESLDHNSQLYSRIFLNQIVPFISKIASMTDTKSNIRVQKAREMLLLDPTFNFVVLDPPEENDRKMWLPP